ncbi:hypothetical protein TPHA_0I03250 [Tetrapisispora phaffii CBS 4417]|uniref:HDA1 complex subunit 3 n=1 Tax=Tetrapisispora phaffii (strain ATCC 24235 / CBS 4417 / NBRC 1672 / NRRL Y-8282 / UCD 70-5) TaxID=1071381 RepID=G8BY48_TETPH|nr:hypothetical protein TPHA_0I03250 [Tetrapisispora phaffii CBS 4417]CCE64826.1 hypothetical protein TPHA_0I03250 [Tetrapisispora phaffii CBS 4417]
MDLLKILDTKPVPEIVNKNFLSISGNTSGDYWLPTPMTLYQKELTDQIVSLHYSDILRYFETDDFEEDVVMKSLETMCFNSQLVATHPFLLIDHNMPKSLITKEVSAHLAETSGKFNVLKDLVNILHEYETDIALICRSGRTMNLIEALLLGNKVNIKRYDGNSLKTKQKSRNFSRTFHLFPSTDLNFKKYPILIKEQFNMVIALDSSVDTNSSGIDYIIRHGRNSTSIPEKAPVIRLISVNTFDHCNLYFSQIMKKGSREFLTYVTAAVVVLRDRVGVLPPDLRPVYSHKLKYLIDWLEDSSLPWPLPDIYPIKKYTPMDVERSLLLEVHYNQYDDSLESAFTNNKKRGFSSVDRDSQKDFDIKTFYNKKRVQNDYSTNPLKQDMSQLTGITTSNNVHGIDYHLSSGILTYKLIQYINEYYVDITLLNAELKDFEETKPIQEKHKEYLDKDSNDVGAKLRELNEKNSSDLEKAAKFENENKKLYEDIERLENSIESSLEIISSKSETLRSMKDSFIKYHKLQEDLIDAKRMQDSKEAENKYMHNEISRAEVSIKENEEEITKIISDSDVLRNNLKNNMEKFKEKKVAVDERIADLKVSLKKSEDLKEELQAKLIRSVEKLNNLPTPRVRATNSSSTSAGRKYKSRKK